MAMFEWLPNEILLQSFQYLHDVHLFCAFHGLNFRLNRLLAIHFRVYHFDFRSISKREFHIVCEQHLPSIIEQVKSLYLSNNDETPNLPEIFHSNYFTLNKFSRLKSLSIDSLHCLSLLNQIILECRQLPYLTHIFIIKCDFKDQINFCHLIENIWNLSKLISCKIDHRFPYELKCPNEIMICSSIENLFVENFKFDFTDLSNLFRCTPSLQQFEGRIIQRNEYEHFHIDSSLITTLNISFRKPFDSMFNFFKNFLNLNRLTIQTYCLYLNGHHWKKIIRNYLSKLKIFQLKMDLKFSHPKHIEEQLNELLNSFRTPFWIEEYQWFVQCHWFTMGISNFAILYTLPYAFQQFLLTNKQWSQSTAPNDKEYHSYDFVNTFTVMNIRNSYSNIPDFRNIIHLKITLPVMNSFWMSLRSLDQLISLDITFVQSSIYTPLQMLLDRSPRLHSLCFVSFADVQIISKLTSKSIYRLDFLHKNTYKKCFNSAQCSMLSNSSLGRQCKVLLISVEDRINIIQLVKNMFNLRSLIFQSKDDKFNDKFIYWFRRHLPSRCLISRDIHQTSNIQL